MVSVDSQFDIFVQGDPYNKLLLGKTDFDFADDDETKSPDFVTLFAAAANIGLMGSDDVAPWTVRCHVSRMSLHEELHSVRWTIESQNLPLAALRILVNMAESRRFSLIQISGAQGASQLHEEHGGVPYPGIFKPVPFPVRTLETLKSSKNRAVRVIFKQPPADQIVETGYEALRLWSYLVMMGGYPQPGQETSTSGAIPDPPFLLDEVTIELAFPEFFSADAAAFAAVVNWAQCVHKGQPLEALEIQ